MLLLKLCYYWNNPTLQELKNQCFGGEYIGEAFDHMMKRLVSTAKLSGQTSWSLQKFGFIVKWKFLISLTSLGRFYTMF